MKDPLHRADSLADRPYLLLDLAQAEHTRQPASMSTHCQATTAIVTAASSEFDRNNGTKPTSISIGDNHFLGIKPSKVLSYKLARSVMTAEHYASALTHESSRPAILRYGDTPRRRHSDL